MRKRIVMHQTVVIRIDYFFRIYVFINTYVLFVIY